MHEFEELLAQYRADHPSLPQWSLWDDWALRREAAIRSAFPARATAADRGDSRASIWLRRQTRLGIAHGFFDDTLLAAPIWGLERRGSLHVTSGPFAILVRAVLNVATDVQMPLAESKLCCGLPSGHTGPMDFQHFAATGEVAWRVTTGCLVGLGKEFSLSSQTVRDTVQRIDKLSARIADLNGSTVAPGAGPHPSVAIDGLRSTLGLAQFVRNTEPTRPKFLILLLVFFFFG